METRLFLSSGDPVAPLEQTPITIILPVYNAFELLEEVLTRVREHTDLPWRLLLIEDCSSDERVRPFLRDWAKEQNRPEHITLIENAQNKGFIGSVNDGLERALALGDHVVLLNSDAFVPQGWASRLLRPILAHDSIASVTPMSNDAEIFSVPAICTRTVLEPGQGDAIDGVANQFHPEATVSVTPTGVGFCMAMNIDFIRKLPQFDLSFGRGYGEEVDWCQRARALGGQHLGLPGLFVEHRGGTSFGNTEKLALVAKNNDIVAGRYPDYDREVQEFIAADPLITARLALALAWAGSFGQEIPVYVAHSLGGGADNYLENRIETEIKATGRPSVILRVGGPVRWQVEVVSESGRVAGTTTDFGFLKELLRPLKARRMIYSCGVGDPDPIALPDRIIELCTSPNHKIDVLFHDFFPISPSYTLLDSKHRYLGPVTPKTTPDPAHRLQRPSGDLVDLPEWQKAWGRLMSSADRIVVFSEDSRHQVTTSYPQTKDRITLIPPDMLAAVPRVQAPTGRRVVAVLGNIGVQKGAGLLQDMARELGDDPDLGLALIGNIDPAYALPTHVPVHGNYAISDIAALVAQYGVTDWLVPSIWPETFCYTVHEALATGLPVYAFDIGAQGEAVRAAENGRPLAYDPDRPLAGEILAAFTCAQEAS
jgi:GT2 family glycosyltransferase/glycosyltransferase involved in cell wall biosynthesis